jgi:hypothetical protein
MSNIFEPAQLLAADLAGANIDPNEAQKALAYVRAQRQGRALFTYLQAINNDGREVIRSNLTLSYYRELLNACERHLRPMQDDPERLIQTFAWSIRLLRYYRAVPNAIPALLQPVPMPDRAQQRKDEPTTALPEVGDIFTGPVTEVGEDAVLVKVPGFAIDKVTGVIEVLRLEGRKYRPGKDTARVEVLNIRTLKSGRVILELKPAPRKKD